MQRQRPPGAKVPRPRSDIQLDLATLIEDTSQGGRARRTLASALPALVALLLSGWAVAASLDGPGATRISYAQGRFVPIPSSIPHEAGDMVDSRIVADLRWIAARFPIYVTDGYSGPLPGGRQVGCRGCHVARSDHHYGLAVDIVPLGAGPGCDASWLGITRLARWAEPRQNRPLPPFRWVGYDGDAGHGCGHHLHLSWNHASGPEFRLSQWVEVFRTGSTATASPGPTGGTVSRPPRPPSGPSGGVRPIPARGGGIGAGD